MLPPLNLRGPQAHRRFRAGKEAVVGILEAGHFFGEGCLNGHPLRVTTATAIDQSLITRIPKAAMIEPTYRLLRRFGSNAS